MNTYRDRLNVSSDDDSDDSDKECNVWKRATVKREEKDLSLSSIDNQVKPELTTEAKPVKKRKNTIWSEVIQDQLISEDFEDCLLKNKPHDYGSRGTESYDYTLKYTDPRTEKDSDSPMSDNAFDEEPRKSNNECSSTRYKKVKKYWKLNSSELTASRKIVKVLNEKKVYLIGKFIYT